MNSISPPGIGVGNILNLRLGLIGIIILSSGCAVHYYDSDTQSEHVWGIGHMMLKASTPRENLKATVRGTALSGLSIGVGDPGTSLTIGWEKRQLVEITDKSTAVRLEWPRGDLLNLRIGSEWPLQETTDGPRLSGGAR